jgi:tripartite-type tricarboxylate transporter receptor subunit TctC
MSKPVLRNTFRGLVAAACAASALSWAQGQGPAKRPLLPDGYPAKPIRVICSSAAGAGLDIVTRAVIAKMAERIGQTLIVDNQGGGTGAIGINLAAAAVPDGYTLLSTGNTTIINAVFNRFERDMRQTLTPVVRMNSAYYFLIAQSTLPAKNIREFIAYAKSRPGKLNYGSNGVGSPIHLGLELIELGLGIDMVHVPYKGGAQANIDFAGGRLDVALTAVSGMGPVRAGKARILAVSSLQRHPEHPDIPTLAESGIPGYDVNNTYMLYAPVQTPASIVAALNKEAIEALRSPDLKAKLSADGSVVGAPYTPEELKKLFVAEYERWDNVIKKTGIRLEE